MGWVVAIVAILVTVLLSYLYIMKMNRTKKQYKAKMEEAKKRKVNELAEQKNKFANEMKEFESSKMEEKYKLISESETKLKRKDAEISSLQEQMEQLKQEALFVQQLHIIILKNQ